MPRKLDRKKPREFHIIIDEHCYNYINQRRHYHEPTRNIVHRIISSTHDDLIEENESLRASCLEHLETIKEYRRKLEQREQTTFGV